MSEIIQETSVSGFDADGEPRIQVMDDGSVWIRFEFMPPSDADDEVDLGDFEDFDKQLEKAAGAAVLWDDREVFVIAKPQPETVDRLKLFLERIRRE